MFVQDKALVSPLGICVLGNKVIVAQSPNVLVYTIDESGDHPVGPPEVLYTGFGGVNHDHGVH
ncbi:MAG: rane-bound dehydrogenase domain protein, partial [Phycisphaerales bacterium]|nr:rane-bound dehydrogenase domain protein [Phycisphaerales bacterium]